MRIWIPLLLVLPFAMDSSAQGGRDPWARMSRHDADKDGKVSREEFPGPDQFFDRMDTDKDGFVTEEEAKNMRRGGGRGGQGGQGGFGRGGRGGQGGGLQSMTKRMDGDGDGKVTQEEWDAFFKKADENEDGILQADELRAALTGRSFNDKAPKVGTKIPEVKAISATDGRPVDLSKPSRTTVLVFGSWT